MTDAAIEKRKAYISKWTPLLDSQLGRYCDPKGKRVLVVGCGWGTEVLWALDRGARFVLGVDPRADDRAVQAIFKERGQPEVIPRFQMLKGMTGDLRDQEPFDLVISLNVFEHVVDISYNLRTLHRLTTRGSRVVIFTAPLYFSSNGSHLHLTPWAHLTDTEESLMERVTPELYKDYRAGLNGMTMIDFITGIRDAGMVLLNMHVRPDRHLKEFHGYSDRIPASLRPMDLCLEGIGVELAFPDQI